MYNMTLQVGCIECGFLKTYLITKHFFRGWSLGVIWNTPQNAALMCSEVEQGGIQILKIEKLTNILEKVIYMKHLTIRQKGAYAPTLDHLTPP